jgi:hypothetical protein
VRRQTVFTRVNNQVPEGSQVLWMEVKSSFRRRERENGGGLRDDFVLEAREEKDRNFSYFAGGMILFLLVWILNERVRNVRRYQLPHACECILQH